MICCNPLCDLLADSLGFTRMRVRDVAIALRKDGLLSINGRGLSAARMTPKDGANLLMALCGSRQVNGAAKAASSLAAAQSAQGLLFGEALAALLACPADDVECVSFNSEPFFAAQIHGWQTRTFTSPATARHDRTVTETVGASTIRKLHQAICGDKAEASHVA